MTPPLATARTTARDVQLRGVPVADPAVGVRGVDRLRRAGHVDRCRRARQWPGEAQSQRREKEGKRGAQFA